MMKGYECQLETEGYSLQISIWSDNPSEIESLARQKAALRLKKIYGVVKTQDQIKVVLVKEKPSVP
ncbi:hypothetical protein [Cohnella zeiphila]|uniref:Asp23/Gls24 family envelope stress response protein n=1 Tax=Cohnella zeiphila TaxID=2761120 RepID=A0A7X0VW51_9BACL|nr:hypothetical protein [Cohnella zeiphila]MBB6732804.1 hypothetical protein [Cohnella zeiphila]